MDHIKNLEEYIKKDFTYNYYKANKDGIYNDLEKDSIKHCQDIEYALDEITALCELIQEMKKTDYKTRIDKAIEYIKENAWYMNKDDEEVLDRIGIEGLLKILEGDNNE